MAELILTPEEKEKSFLDWDDESLGRAVKYVAAMLDDRKDGGRSLAATAAGYFLISRSVEANSVSSTLLIQGLKDREKSLGDWKIIMQKVAVEGEEGV